ncbi:keratin-associated protein 19-3-like [Centruroides sculpturatus]|uniref:keratin-associated protein 19-3-like n=1 Tax=Centruroides sculpturatus TaxID=218467 RepID=UPI000C6E3F92|nr:keratin-associated protein 19-3-like [Centruroides sculpturatus]
MIIGSPERYQYNRGNYARPYYGVYGFPRTRYREHRKPHIRGFGGYGRYGRGRNRGRGKYHERSSSYDKPFYDGGAYGGGYGGNYGGGYGGINNPFFGYGERGSFYRSSHGAGFRPFNGFNNFYG